ncbi:MAG: hypothetical protein KIG53_04495 [Oscillospiraceae bacterium]|nr:hypothetical protein [Oscillospiraceae bacterium]
MDATKDKNFQIRETRPDVLIALHQKGLNIPFSDAVAIVDSRPIEQMLRDSQNESNKQFANPILLHGELEHLQSTENK